MDCPIPCWVERAKALEKSPSATDDIIYFICYEEESDCEPYEKLRDISAKEFGGWTSNTEGKSAGKR